MTHPIKCPLQARYARARNYAVAQRAMAVHFGFIPYGMEREDIVSIATTAYVRFYRTRQQTAADPRNREDDERKRLFRYVSTAITDEKRLFDRLSKYSRGLLNRIHRQQRADLLEGKDIPFPSVEGIEPAKVRELLEMERKSLHVPMPDGHVVEASCVASFDDVGEVLRGAVAKLPRQERTAVRLNILEGWPARRVAIKLGKCESTAVKTLRRGLRMLRRMPEVGELARNGSASGSRSSDASPWGNLG